MNFSQTHCYHLSPGYSGLLPGCFLHSAAHSNLTKWLLISTLLLITPLSLMEGKLGGGWLLKYKKVLLTPAYDSPPGISGLKSKLFTIVYITLHGSDLCLSQGSFQITEPKLTSPLVVMLYWVRLFYFINNLCQEKMIFFHLFIFVFPKEYKNLLLQCSTLCPQCPDT